jgi:hypothetical protein
MRRRQGEAGDGKLGCILWVLLLLVGLLIAWKAIPVKIASSELYDFMVEQAKWAGQTDAETIEKRIFAKATELNIPVDRRRVEAVKAGGKLRMRATYTVPLEFPGYTYNWEFDLQVERPIFIF